MNIACSSCPAKYAVPDEKVRGRKVRITCKRCGAAIIVDGTDVQDAAPAPEAAAKVAAAPAPEASSPMAAGTAVAIPKPGGSKQAAKAAPAAASFPKPAAAAAKPKEPSWTVAVTDDDHRDMTTTQVVDAYAEGVVDAEAFIWRDGMEDWLTAFEIPEIAAALDARGLKRPVTGGAEEPPPQAPAKAHVGAWREPGKIGAKKAAAPVEPNPVYEEPTVAISARKAQALIDAVHSEPDAGASISELGEPGGPAAAAALLGGAGTDESEKPALESERLRLPFEAPEAPEPSAPRAAVKPREDAPDLFGGSPLAGIEDVAPRTRMPSIPPEPASHAAMTGARNESSVLFSLDQLMGKAAPKAAPRAAEKVDAESLLLGGGPSRADDDAPPSVAKFGGALFAPSNAAANMAAPDFTAPAASAPSNPAPARPSAAPAPPPKKSSNTGMFVGIGAVVLLGGAAAAFLLKPAPPVPPPEATAPVVTAAPQPAATNPPTIPASAAAPVATDTAPAPSAAASAAAPAISATAAATAAVTAAATAAPTAPAGAAPTAPKPQTPAAPTTAAAAKPAAPEAPAPAAGGADFDKDAAAAALSAAAAGAQSECASQDGTHGVGKVTITFVNSGRATNALVSGDFAGSALGGCVARVFRGVHVPAFGGDSVRVTKTVRIP